MPGEGVQTSLFGSETKLSNKKKLLFLTIFVAWTSVIGGLLYWSFELVNQRILKFAQVQTRSTIEQDILYRRWNAQHGGVYGQVSEFLKPNEYIKGKDRDIVTTSGLKLTKINPAYMTRQVHELGATASGVIGHITSLDPIRPENKADVWEAEVLRKMESAPKEAYTIQELQGEMYLRMMIPLVTEEGCLKCHAEQGFKVGDIRGGISASVPLAPLFANVWNDRISLIAGFGLAWLFGCATILGIARIKTAEVRLRSSEEKYRTLVETMSEGTIILDAESRIVFSSTPMADMLGYVPQDIQGTDFRRYISYDITDDYEQLVDHLDSVEQISFETELQTRDSGSINVLFSPKAIRGDRDMYLGTLAVVTDITKLKELEKEIIRQQRLSTLGSLAGGVAHEINNPAQFLKANTSFLQEVVTNLKTIDSVQQTLGSDVMDDVSAALNENMQGIQRIADIVASVKNLSGTDLAYPESVDINTLVKQSFELTRNTWESVAELAMELADGLPKIECVTRDITQVITAILVNAADAIAEKQSRTGDTSKGRITIETRAAKGGLQIIVTDSGAGIPEDNLKMIFEPFYTTKDPGKGVGQGLAIAYRIVSDHAGSLAATSEEGVGSEFVVTLPV